MSKPAQDNLEVSEGWRAGFPSLYKGPLVVVIYFICLFGFCYAPSALCLASSAPYRSTFLEGMEVEEAATPELQVEEFAWLN